MTPRSNGSSGASYLYSQFEYKYPIDHDGDDNSSALANWFLEDAFLEREATWFSSTLISTTPYVGASFLGGLAETVCASSTTTTTIAPLYGLCKRKHRPKVAAQSGHCGYCRKCFGVFFPRESKPSPTMPPQSNDSKGVLSPPSHLKYAYPADRDGDDNSSAFAIVSDSSFPRN